MLLGSSKNDTNKVHFWKCCNLSKLSIIIRCAWGPLEVVTMPEQGQDWEAGSNARVSGWGTLSSGGSSPDTLQAVNVPVVSDADCADAYGNDMDGPTMICAGEEGLDSCQGDSGGPMTCGNNDDGEADCIGI